MIIAHPVITFSSFFSRRWVQAVFRISRDGDSTNVKMDNVRPQIKDITPKADPKEIEIDMSEGMAIEMFGITSSSEEVCMSYILLVFKKCFCYLLIDFLEF